MFASKSWPGEKIFVLHPVDGPRLERRVERVVRRRTELGDQRPRQDDRGGERADPDDRKLERPRGRRSFSDDG